MVHGKNRISYRIDRRLSGLAGPGYDATISFGLPFEPEDSQYGEYRLKGHQEWQNQTACPGASGREVAPSELTFRRRRVS